MAIKPKCNNCGKELKEFGADLVQPAEGGHGEEISFMSKSYKEVSRGLGKKYQCRHGK